MGTFVLSNRNIIIPSPDGKAAVRLRRGSMETVPGWAAKTAYFKALVADGKLVVSDGRKDKDLEKGQEAEDGTSETAAQQEEAPAD